MLAVVLAQRANRWERWAPGPLKRRRVDQLLTIDQIAGVADALVELRGSRARSRVCASSCGSCPTRRRPRDRGRLPHGGRLACLSTAIGCLCFRRDSPTGWQIPITAGGDRRARAAWSMPVLHLWVQSGGDLHPRIDPCADVQMGRGETMLP